MAGPKKFWVVWNSNNKKRGPVKRQSSQETALSEATRIAEKHPGCKLYVLEAKCYSSTGEAMEGGMFPPVTTTPL